MHRIYRDDGATLVETAITCSLIMMILLGIIQMCQVLYAYHYVAQAARMGTRYAMVRGSACTSFSTACPASGADIQTYVKALGFPGINPANMTVTTAWSQTSGSNCASACNSPGNLVSVQVRYAVGINIPFVRRSNLNLSSTSQVVISQ